MMEDRLGDSEWMERRKVRVKTEEDEMVERLEW